MKRKINPGHLKGTIIAPSSKSYSQRAVLAAALAHGTSIINNIGENKDTDALVEALRTLGVLFNKEGDTLEIQGGINFEARTSISIGESGLATRLMTPVMSLFDKEITITGQGTILSRKMDFMQPVLETLGAKVSFTDGKLPVTLQGPIKPNSFSIDCSQSSQFLSGLLFALPLCPDSSEINVLNLASRPYIQITIDVLSQFGIDIIKRTDDYFLIPGGQKYKSSNYTIEGDWSGASTLLIAPGRKTIRGLNVNSSQADREIISAIKLSGLNVVSTGTDITVFGTDVSAFSFDATDCPDLFPALAVLAVRASSGVSELIGTNRLINKESNRLLTIRDQFKKMGIFIDIEKENKMYIPGGQKVHSSQDVSSCSDHRIAMALASLALLADDGSTIIDEAEAVSKSYKNFWNDFNILFTYE